MRSKRQVINEILTQCVRDGDSDGFRMFNEMLDEVIREGTADLPSLFEVNDEGSLFLVNTAAPRPQGDQ
jgi:hypothetical protein